MAAQRLDDARRAIAHSSLAGLAEEALAKLEEEMDALEQIYLNLGRVLLAAKSVDEQRILSSSDVKIVSHRGERKQSFDRSSPEAPKPWTPTFHLKMPTGPQAWPPRPTSLHSFSPTAKNYFATSTEDPAIHAHAYR